ncbi:MAG: 4-hydroxybenzoate octaprenyltransferase [Nitrospirae bacterium]|nr:4-hydroxybenzoate octaprenyltransferase [Nitrospirota bacterium]
MITILKNKLPAALDLMRISKQYGTLLLLMPTLWSLVVAAQGTPPLKVLTIFILGSFLMRTAGCVINDIADRNFDGHVERTRARPLPSGRLSVAEAAVIFGLILAAAFYLAFQLNPLTRWLSLIGVALAVVYPFSKRFTSFPQMVMGIAFGWGSIMAWTAVRNSVELPVVMIFLANLCWAAAYDTIYALMDREDDLRIGVKSSAILFGRKTWIAVGILFVLSSFFFILLGLTARLGAVYYATIGAATGWFIIQAWTIRHPLNRPTVFSLFKSNVGVGLLVLLGLVLNYHGAYGQTALSKNPSLSPNETCTNCHTADGPPKVDYSKPECLECHSAPDDAIATTVSEKRSAATSGAASEMILIPAGEFIMGNNGRGVTEGAGDPDEMPEHRAYLDAYWIDKYEVSNTQYMAFVDMTRHRPPKHWQPTGAGQGMTYPPGKADHPVIYVDWYDANEYCHWVERRLPTEEEWEKAARGTDGRVYPWGNAFDPKKANSPQYWLAANKDGDTMPVGSFENGKSPYGLYDMAGNVYEWTANWYKPYPLNHEFNVHYGEKNKIVRGGSWYDCLSYGCGLSAPSYNRSRFAPEIRNKGFGFRCAKSKE